MSESESESESDGDVENPYNNPQYIPCPDQYKDVWRGFSESMQSQYDKDKTIERRKQTARYWFAWCAENDVDPFTEDQRKVNQYVDDHANLGDQALSARISGVSMLHEWAYNQGKIDHDELVGISAKEDIEGVDPTRVQKDYEEGLAGPDENYKYATKEDVEKMLENVPAPETRNICLIKCLWQCGMRSQELATLELDNVYPDENRMIIRSAKKDPDEDNYWREVFYQDDLAFYLKKWMEKERHTLGPYHEDSEYVFLTHQSEQMRPSHISRIVKQSAQNAGIQTKIGEDANGNPRWKFTAHAIRHGHAHHVCNFTNTPVHITANQLGHTVDTLVETYVQEDRKAQREWYLDRDEGASSVL